VGTTAHQEPAIPSLEAPAPAPAALVSFARMLARHAAQEAFAATQLAAASESDQSEPRVNHEAED